MAQQITRRDVLVGAGILAVAGGIGVVPTGRASASTNRPWRDAAAVRRRVRPPRFPDRSFGVTAFGAVGDGATDCTDAIRHAIEACHHSGGGRVVVPAGTFATGAVHLLSGVELHVSEGATLSFSRDPADYLPVVHSRYEGVELMNYSPFVYAYRQRDVAITGGGVLDGRADATHWWDWTSDPPPTESPDKALLAQLAADGVPVEQRVFGAGHYLRPNLLQLYACENVLIEGVTVRDSPMWNIHPVLCRNVTIRSVVVDSPDGPNNDGIDPESCADVVIEDCRISTGDDCIALKAGKDADGRRVGVPCRDVVVLACEMADGNGGVTIGSETTGGVWNVYVRHCRMSSPHLERAVRLKSNPQRGGTMKNLHFDHIEVGVAADSVVEMVLNYANVTTGDYPPDVHGIVLSHLDADTAPRALNLLGLDDVPLRDIELSVCRFAHTEEPDITSHVDGLVLDRVWENGARIDTPS